MSHELVGLSEEELQKHYYNVDEELKDVLEPFLGKDWCLKVLKEKKYF